VKEAVVMAEACEVAEFCCGGQDHVALLRKVRAELRSLIETRMKTPLTRAQQVRYDLLCERERELLGEVDPEDSAEGNDPR